MKPHKLLVSMCICSLLLTACAGSSAPTESSAPGEYKDASDATVLATDDHFRVIKEGAFAYSYEIYDSQGSLVIRQETGSKYPNVESLGDVIHISIGIGTGLALHQYYSISRGCFSPEFQYVVASNGEMVAFLQIPEHDALQNRTLVIQNIFDEASYSKEIRLDLAPVDTPVLQASFSPDAAQLQITYLQGEDAHEATETIDR